MNKITITLLLSFLSSFLLAQDLPFSGTKDKKADYYFGEALKTFQMQDFMRASQWIDKAVGLDPNFIDAWMLKAEMKSMDENYPEAIAIYEKIKGINPDFPMSYYGIAKAYYANGNYAASFAAAEKFLSYPDYYKKKDIIERIKQNSAFGIEAVKNPVPFNPVNLGNMVNSPDNEYFPGIPADDQTLIFTRLINGRNEDFFISKKQADGKYSFAANMGFPINTEGNEGTISLSADGQYIFYTACNRREGAYGSCDLYISKLDGVSWAEPINLGPPVNTASWESQPCVSFDGKTLYFSSNRPGGFGRSDIWYTTFKDGRWTPPINMGPEINTSGEEQSPHIAKDDQTLYFNSTGHPGMGGVDLFIARKVNGRWTKPQNLGYPINSMKDETCLVIASNGVDAYIARDGDDSKGGLDIYKFELPENIRPQKTGYVKGIVLDAATRKRINAKIELIDLATGKIVVEAFSNKTTGEFLVCLQANKNYALNIDQKGYLFYSENFEIKNESSLAPKQIEVNLQPLSEGSKIVLKNIFFDVDKFELKEESKVELNKLIQFLNTNPTVKIEIGGHTDNTGDATKNTNLSANRAKAVLTYLVTNGIKADRLTSKGYAATQPIADNQTVEGRAQNRRTEIRIISR
jgi:outer membrane protein OmpA-like peptidoglycan-associated protein